MNEEEAKYLLLNYRRNVDEAKYLFLNYRRNEDEAKYLFPNYRRNEDEAKYLFLNYLRNEDEAKYSFLNYLRNEDEAKYSFLNYRWFAIATQCSTVSVSYLATVKERKGEVDRSPFHNFSHLPGKGWGGGRERWTAHRSAVSLSYLAGVEEEEGRGGPLTVPQYHYPTWWGLSKRKGEVDHLPFRTLTILPGGGWGGGRESWTTYPSAPSLSYLAGVEEEEGRVGPLTLPHPHYPTWRGLSRRKGEVDRSPFRSIR
jgi:hypothetical protein